MEIKLYFCIADKPPFCEKKTNICCIYCDNYKKCQENHKLIKNKVQICSKEDYQDCPFLI